MLAETFPGIAVLIWGAGDDRSNYHSLDESVDLADLERIVLAEALFIRTLADGPTDGWPRATSSLSRRAARLVG